MDSSDDEDDRDALCIDLGTLRWRVGLCGDDAPKYVLLTRVTVESVTAHPLASKFGMAEPDLAGTEPMHLVNQLLAMAIADVPEARQYLWDLQCQALQRVLTELLGSRSSTNVLCTLPMFTEAGSDAMSKHLHVFFGESGPFHHAGFTVDCLLFAHQEVLQLYASGSTTGLSVNLGSTITILPVLEGYPIASAARRHSWPVYSKALLPHLVAVITEALDACPVDIRVALAQYIFISGETSTKLEELRCKSSAEHRAFASTDLGRAESATDLTLQHLQQALRETGRHKSIHRVVLYPERPFNSWIGASILGSLSNTWSYLMGDTWYGPNVAWHGRRELAAPGCFHPTLGDTATLILQCDKAEDLAFARQQLAWAKATIFCGCLDDAAASEGGGSFDVVMIDEIGERARHSYAASRSTTRGVVLPSDADEMTPLIQLGIRSPLDSAGPQMWDDPTPEDATWLEIWSALGAADNNVCDHLGQMHRAPEQLEKSQDAGFSPVRCAPWLLMGQNWYGNMMHREVSGFWPSARAERRRLRNSSSESSLGD